MVFFGSGFLEIRNKYVIPMVSYGITSRKSQYWDFKDTISSKLISLNKLSNQNLEIELYKQDYYKSLHCEMELVLNKVFVQYVDFIKSKELSKSWSFITLYYLSFFLATCLFRFLNRGFIFLSSEQIRRFGQFSLAMYSSPIALNSGNYFFSFKEINSYGNVVLSINHKDDSVHKSTWLQLESVLRELLTRADIDEKTVLNLLIAPFNSFQTQYPSILRNKLNYRGDSSLLDFNNSIPYLNLQDIDGNFLRDLSGIDLTANSNQNQMKCIGLLASYLLKIVLNLYQEYYERSSFGNDFHKERLKYLMTSGIPNVFKSALLQNP